MGNLDAAPEKLTTPKRRRRIGWKSYTLLAIVLVVGGILATRMIQASADENTGIPTKIEIASTSEQAAATEQTAASPAETPEPTGPLIDRITQQTIEDASHPFGPLLELAEECLATIDADIQDYTATLTSQVRVDGELMPEKQLFCKIRHPRTTGDDLAPFSVYTRFLHPANNRGQEAIWVDTWNKGNLVAHLSGLANVKRFYLQPESKYAMDGNLHPIYDIGFRNLIVKMQAVGQNDLQYDECEVRVDRNLEINGRPCVLLEARHPEQRDHFEFHIARIYIDAERRFPLAYEGYEWPTEPGGEPVLIEKYYYTDVQTNVGLVDLDFDPANPDYQYPSW